jgi:hypothetical protein
MGADWNANSCPRLEAVDPKEQAAPGSTTLDERIAAALADSAGAMPFAELATAAASAPPPCTSASPPSPTPAASSRPTMATASPATDSDTFDNQDKDPRPSAEFPLPLPGLMWCTT